MHTIPQTPAVTPLAFCALKPHELADVAHHRQTWLWHGYLGPGKVTALVSPPKTGKTTLLTHLLAAMAHGGELAGLAVAAGRALVVSEEAEADWDERCRRLGLGPHVQFVCRPFRGARPSEAQWAALVAGIDELHRREPLDLVVLDALAALLPGHAEANAPQLLDCLLPVQALAQRGVAVWLLHHPAKAKRADGQAARGTGALAGFCDVVLELSPLRRLRNRDRRRRLAGYSRYAETPRRLVIELSADGSGYQLGSDAEGALLVDEWAEVREVLEGAHEKLTQARLLAFWPSEGSRPERTTLSRWLVRAARQGLIRRGGKGTKSDPYVYWLAGREELLYPGESAGAAAKEAWRDRVAAETARRMGLTGAGW